MLMQQAVEEQDGNQQQEILENQQVVHPPEHQFWQLRNRELLNLIQRFDIPRA